jgi:hypothetical protein
MSAVATAQEQLRTGWHSLQQEWRTTCDLWNDSVHQRFEQEFWQEWEQTVPSTLDAMQRLAEVMSAAQRAVR